MKLLNYSIDLKLVLKIFLKSFLKPFLKACFIIGLAISWFLLNTTKALPEDKSLPMELSSDSADYDQIKGIGVYKGNVLVKQGSLEVYADIGYIYTIDKVLDRIEAEGAPIKMKYLPDVNKEWVNGEGKILHYDAKTGIITISKNAKFTQGGDVITGDSMSYDTNNDIIRAKSGSNERVKMIIQPNSELRK
ncbi:lipopolysaccharide export system protein LptA [Gammaproteobacteria bacterium]|nr:lipopolysaccharide export system protein LptA [Gammaproteobacteria bacterium]